MDTLSQVARNVWGPSTPELPSRDTAIDVLFEKKKTVLRGLRACAMETRTHDDESTVIESEYTIRRSELVEKRATNKALQEELEASLVLIDDEAKSLQETFIAGDARDVSTQF